MDTYELTGLACNYCVNTLAETSSETPKSIGYLQWPLLMCRH